ncbi:hypothetical protein J3459_011472 [Metarhizium acridum]|nr:hypothetical protein J3459_011472 [Metarhizium acridum]
MRDHAIAFVFTGQGAQYASDGFWIEALQGLWRNLGPGRSNPQGDGSALVSDEYFKPPPHSCFPS